MDDKDRLLLTLLRRDARRPVVALARDLGLSRSATQDRLAKLRSSGAISSFTIIQGGDASTLEIAYLTVRLETGLRCAQVVPRLRAIPAIETIHSVGGAIDLVLRIAAPNLAGIEAARSAVAGTTGVAEVATFVVLERHLG